MRAKSHSVMQLKATLGQFRSLTYKNWLLKTNHIRLNKKLNKIPRKLDKLKKTLDPQSFMLATVWTTI